VQLKTAEVFAAWDGIDNGPLTDDWQLSRNDLEAPAKRIVPQIKTVLAWLSAQAGAEFVRMSGSGATCFALFESEEQCKRSAEAVPREWWHLETSLR
jgi:4-diphosphocytidyl-2-C-methyl-D-erythritol kinase